MAAADPKKLLTQLDQTRAKVTGIKAALADLDRQPIAPSDVADRAEQVVQHLARRVDSSWLGRVVADPAIDLDGDMQSDFLAEAIDGSKTPGPLLAWLFPDLLRERLIDLTTEHATGTVPLAQRPAERQKLEESLYQLECDEERIVCACEEAGVEALRRSDIDPSVVLTAHLET